MTDGTLLQKASEEIVDLHRFFVAWYNTATSGGVDFNRCQAAFGDGFHIITPTGGVFDRTQTIEMVRSNHATFDGDFEIAIEDIEARWQSGDALLVTYVEVQWRGGEHSRRLATALFTESASAPCGVEWRHLQETWLQMPGT